MSVSRGGSEELSKWLDRMVLKVAPEDAGKLHAKVHIQVGDGVILDTPVGNPDLWESPPPKNYVGGRARGNWQSTIDTIPSEEMALSEDPSGEGRSRQEDAEVIADRIDPGDVSYITNNVPYIERLNDGWSTQAPAAFVQANIQRVAAQF